MVALTADGKPAPVPPVDPQTDDERRRQREAEHRRATRLREREEIVAARSSGAE
jgi:acyl-CoA hydrolase